MDYLIKSILLNARNIAIIGASSNPKKDSFILMKFLQSKGFKVIPINSKTLSQIILGEKVYKNIEEVNKSIDIVDIFRPSSEIFDLVNIIISKKIKTVWLQLGIFCSKSENKLNHFNINFIQNKCTKIEYDKLFK